MKLTVDIDGKRDLDYAIGQIREGVTDWREVWPEVERVFYVSIMEQFKTEGARGGNPWAPLTEKYRKWKEAKYPGQPLLVRTGRFRRSLSVLGSGDAVRIREKDSLTLGSSVPYGRFHQRGTRKMKARPPLVLRRNDYGKMVSRMYRYAERVGRDAGFKTETRAFFTPGAA